MPAEASGGPRVLTQAEIEQAVELPALLEELEQGFRWYSDGRAVVPPVGYLRFGSPVQGDVHIKYGYLREGSHYVVKIASEFAPPAGEGATLADGLMLLFSQTTGSLEALLLDRGYLTAVRTGLAGALAARYLAPAVVTRIGILGTGRQARLQLRMLRLVTSCRRVTVWGRRPPAAAALQREMSDAGYDVAVADEPAAVAAACNLIVTVTAATAPLLQDRDVAPGTHITAVGADARGKQELAPGLFARADLVAVDSLAQCIDHGEVSNAVAAGRCRMDRLVELGTLIAAGGSGRARDTDLTIADLTGIAVQDLIAASHVWARTR